MKLKLSGTDYAVKYRYNNYILLTARLNFYCFAVEDVTENISIISREIIHEKRMRGRNIKKQ